MNKINELKRHSLALREVIEERKIKIQKLECKRDALNSRIEEINKYISELMKEPIKDYDIKDLESDDPDLVEFTKKRILNY